MSDDKIQSQIAWHEKEIARLQRLLPRRCARCGELVNSGVFMHDACALYLNSRRHQSPVNRVLAALDRLSRNRWIPHLEARALARRLSSLTSSRMPTRTADAATKHLNFSGMYRGESLVKEWEPHYHQVVAAIKCAEKRGKIAMLIAAFAVQIKESKRAARETSYYRAPPPGIISDVYGSAAGECPARSSGGAV